MIKTPGVLHQIRVKAEGTLLDTLLREWADQKKTVIRQTLKHGSVRVNDRTVTWHLHPLKPGDRIKIVSRHHADAEKRRDEFGYQILYEDPQCLLVDKPAGLLTVGTDDERRLTLYYELNEYLKLRDGGRGQKVWIVHRLDRDTSGLVLFAKTEEAKRTLQKGWDKVTKKYVALTEGVPSKKEGVVRSFLKEDEAMNVYSVHAKDPHGKEAITHYKVLRSNGSYALVEVWLGTGRKNQIRVHMADLGTPVVGDKKYGAKSDPIRRLGLHAYFLSVVLPPTSTFREFRSPIPSSFEKLIRQ